MVTFYQENINTQSTTYKHCEDQFELKPQINTARNKSDSNVKYNIGPNVNIKFLRKSDPTLEEKEFFKKKIKLTKKTEMCKNWSLFKDCYFKDKCSFAHGEAELRPKKEFETNVKYKTKICKSFVERNYCQFGQRCQYNHIVYNFRILPYRYFIYKLPHEILKECDKKNVGPSTMEDKLNKIKMNNMNYHFRM